MTPDPLADVTPLFPHQCPYRLWTTDGWVSVSRCHFGLPIDDAAPGLKPAARPATGGAA